jgi:hypothetical protein
MPSATSPMYLSRIGRYVWRQVVRDPTEKRIDPFSRESRDLLTKQMQRNQPSLQERRPHDEAQGKDGHLLTAGRLSKVESPMSVLAQEDSACGVIPLQLQTSGMSTSTDETMLNSFMQRAFSPVPSPTQQHVKVMRRARTRI